MIALPDTIALPMKMDEHGTIRISVTRDAGEIPWDWKRSLTLQMIVMGAAVLVLGLVA